MNGWKLWKNGEVYAPAHLGKRDILICNGTILAVEEDLACWEKQPGMETLDLHGLTVFPGLVDQHVHVTGGGGELGPASRVPELRLSALMAAGITTVCGLLGTDGLSRSLENLLYKCRALEEEGVTARMLTGSYRYPSPTLTGDVQRDIALIDLIVGVKIAIGDHRSSHITGEELIRLASEARVGGMLGGKPGMVVLHTGESERRLDLLFYVLEHSDIPAAGLLPTHCCRTPALVADAVRFNKRGGTVDFTADDMSAEAGTAAAVASALRQGADPGRITMSSDACGSLPKFDRAGACIGLTQSSPGALICELRRLVQDEKVPTATALRFFTENPARVLGFRGAKGRLAAGADADILAVDQTFSVRHLLAKGKTAVLDGTVLLKGRFE